MDAVIAESPYSSASQGMLDILTNVVSTMPRWVQLASLLPLLVPAIVATALQRLGQHPRAAEDAADHLAPRPVLLIHGTLDRRFPTTHSTRVFDRLTHAAKGLAGGAAPDRRV